MAEDAPIAALEWCPEISFYAFFGLGVLALHARRDVTNPPVDNPFAGRAREVILDVVDDFSFGPIGERSNLLRRFEFGDELVSYAQGLGQVSGESPEEFVAGAACSPLNEGTQRRDFIGRSGRHSSNSARLPRHGPAPPVLLLPSRPGAREVCHRAAPGSMADPSRVRAGYACRQVLRRVRLGVPQGVG